MNNEIRQVLCDVITQFGIELSDDPRRFANTLNDLCPAAKREIKALRIAAEEIIPRQLIDESKHEPPLLVIGRLTKKLENSSVLSKSLALWAVESWAIALDIVTLESIHLVVACPECSARLTASLTYAGRQVKCHKCSYSFKIDQAGLAASLPSVDRTKVGSGERKNSFTSASYKHSQIREMVGAGQWEQALNIVSQALTTHPNDDVFDLWMQVTTAVPDPKDEVVLSRVSDIWRIRQGDVWAVAVLACALVDAKRRSEAKKLLDNPKFADSLRQSYPLKVALLLALPDKDPEIRSLLGELVGTRPKIVALLAGKRSMKTDGSEAIKITEPVSFKPAFYPEWYLDDATISFGPWNYEFVVAKLAEGSLSPLTMASPVGHIGWKPLGEWCDFEKVLNNCSSSVVAQHDAVQTSIEWSAFAKSISPPNSEQKKSDISVSLPNVPELREGKTNVVDAANDPSNGIVIAVFALVAVLVCVFKPEILVTLACCGIISWIVWSVKKLFEWIKAGLR